jgi:hypothetical protein
MMAMLHLQTALQKVVCNNADARQIAKTSHFQAILAEKMEAWFEVDAGQKEAKLLGLQSRLARILWQCEEMTFILTNMHRECKWICQIIQQHHMDGTPWMQLMSHIMQQQPDWEAHQDASTNWGMGGHSPNLR